jgi:hypothetical protein
LREILKEMTIMEIFFLNFVQAINDNLLWLGPVLVVCILVLIISEIKEVFKDMLKDMEEPEVGKGQRSEVRGREGTEVRGQRSDI